MVRFKPIKFIAIGLVTLAVYLLVGLVNQNNNKNHRASIIDNDDKKVLGVEEEEKRNNIFDAKHHQHVAIVTTKKNADEFFEAHLVDSLAQKFGVQKNRVKDWHNYQQMASDSQRQGPGEQGAPYILTQEEAKAPEKHNLLRANGFNALVSDKISLQRSLNDIRHPLCKKKLYMERLPKVSVVIPFHNEHFTTLLRSVYSIVNRTPRELLEEIILVDDYSDKEFLKQKLDDFIATNFRKDLVKVLRLEKREGLIRTRMAGARIAKADVLIFFDSHIECNLNWLPPLIEPIAQNSTTVVCPFIDVINEETFAYTAQDNGARGAFDWHFNYKRLPLLEKQQRSPIEPFDNPVMAGGLFAIDKNWFFKLGGYDEGLEFWGAEQYELSFKVWQCGGRMVDAPCSRVGHIYRKFNPFSYTGGIPYLSNNYKRVAEVWMDEYKEFLYDKQPSLRAVSIGDLSKQHQLRKNLQCKSFKWFMEEVAFDLTRYYPPKPIPPYGSGEISSMSSPDLCIDTKFRPAERAFGLDTCLSVSHESGGEQNFEYTFRLEIKPARRNICFDVSHSSNKSPVLLFDCHGYRGNQEFRYRLDTNQLHHPVSNLCIDSNPSTKEIYMSPCDSGSVTQRWKFQKLDVDLIKKDFKI